MIKSFTHLALILLISSLIGCTKDIVPNPETITNPVQSVIYDQTFNAAYPSWPSGWSASPSKSGWVMDTSTANNSLAAGLTTYTDASGGAMVEVSNPTTTNATDLLYSAPISTVGYTSISITYGVRNSSKFNSNGSSISLAWSSDGATWNNIPFTDANNDGNWYLINDGIRINLPAAAANQPSIQFQWTANLVITTSGTYRIDDFQVFGTAN